MLARVLALAALPGLAACGDDLQRTFGFSRNAPDEFTVTTRAPLSMPPSFALRPPRPGADRPQETSQTGAAEAALVPQAALSGPARGSSPGQQALISQAGPTPPADIRRKVDEDALLETPDQRLTDRLMFWRATPEKGAVIDPSAESKRLRENAALGQPADANTPIFSQPKPGLLDRIF